MNSSSDPSSSSSPMPALNRSFEQISANNDSVDQSIDSMLENALTRTMVGVPNSRDTEGVRKTSIMVLLFSVFGRKS